jgi:dTDP-4-amino-4,6-dideoxygalactose transaminase/SAM-dependent methyltransferase
MNAANHQNPYPKLDHDQYARTTPMDDLWGQVKRTVAGNPVDGSQIEMIVKAIRAGLQLTPDDNLLDIGCGNGALSQLLFDSCREFLGVDLSEYLISVAKSRFEILPNFEFLAKGAAEYLRQEPMPNRFTKALCYGCFPYFSAEDAAEILRLIFDKFTNIRQLFVGNLPDLDRAVDFYTRRIPSDEELFAPDSMIGIWRNKDEFAELANGAGWEVRFSSMPTGFYSAHYRYDALLYRPAKLTSLRVTPDCKNSVAELAVLGAGRLFTAPRSTSNLVRPDLQNFLNYSRIFFEQRQYTNEGPLVRLLEKRLARFHQTEFCVTFCNGFWGIVLAMTALARKGKSEVIMPSFTYRRLADIATWAGLKPHFCEVNEDTLALSAETVSRCINDDTALILCVQPIVNCCDVEELVALAKERTLPLLFDSVESIYETVAGGKIGCFGDAECFSLHASKLINGFEGGYVTTNNATLAQQLATIRGFGFKGQDNVIMPRGTNAKLNEIHAAMALATFDDLEEQVRRNRQIYDLYKYLLADIPGIRLLEYTESQQPSYKNIVVELLDNWPLTRANTLKALNAENIMARAYYAQPLHRKKMAYPYVPADLPLTDRLSKRFLLMPCGALIKDDDIHKIVGFMSFIHANSDRINNRLQTKGEA